MIETTRTPVFSRYEVLERIGSGGMGTVYKARDLHLDRWVALKVLPPGMRGDVEALERFKREARALARLKHPRVAAVYDAHVEGGFPHLVMEYVEGENLERRLQQQSLLPEQDAVRLGIEVAEALEHIHSHNLVHRDVKTSNIIIGAEGKAVLTDFGIAFEPSLPRISQGALGTPEYMSPEQAGGRVLDGRSDLYSLGVVLYECLTGTLPFQRQGESLAALTGLMTDVLEAPVPPLRVRCAAVPAWLEAVVLKCLAKEPAERFATAAELALALRMAGASEKPVTVAPRNEAMPGPPPDQEETDEPADDVRVLHRGPRRGLSLISHVRPVDAVAFSPDGSRLASASEDGLIRIWQVGDGQLLQTLEGHEGNVVSVAFSPDGRYLASGDVAGGVCIWDAGAGQLVRRLDGHSALVMSVAFSPDGRSLVTGGADRAVRIWNYRRGNQERTAGWHDGYVLATAFSPDGAYVASGGADGEVRIWDVRKGRLVRALEGHGAWVMSVAFSPDGTRLASGGADEAVHVWHAGTGAHLQTLRGHRAWVMSVAFSPGSAHLASAGRDHTIRLWDVGAGRMLRRLDGHTGPVTSLAFSPNGQYLASGSSDCTVRFWPLHARTFRKRWPLRHVAGWTFIAMMAAASLWSEDGLVRPPDGRATSAAVVHPVPERAPAHTPPAASDADARAPARSPARPVPPPLYSREGIDADRGGWTLVVSTGWSRLRAERVADEYRDRGFRCSILVRSGEDGRQYVVGIGQYPDRTDATRARRRLAGHELPVNTWLMRIREEG